MAVAFDGDLWVPFKELQTVLQAAVNLKQIGIFADLERQLNKHKPAFSSLLKNPNKNNKHLEYVKNSKTNGIQLQGSDDLIKLTDDFIIEALRLSQALDLNELSSVELLLAAEQQVPNFPGLSRQLVAVILYEDGKRCLLSSLKLILIASKGKQWTIDLDNQVTHLIDIFANNLIKDGLVTKLLQLLSNASVQNELLLLHNNQLLGDGKHKRLITELITEKHHLMSDCLFNLACQKPFGQVDLLALLDYLKTTLSDSTSDVLDHSLVKLLMCVLASLDSSSLEADEENGEIQPISLLPITKEPSFLDTIHKCLIKNDLQSWKIPQIKSCLQFMWAVYLRSCGNDQFASEILEEDEHVLNLALDGDAFNYIAKKVIMSKEFKEEEFFIKLMHQLLTNFIVKFPLKTKELRNQGDENARIVQVHRQNGVDPPDGLNHSFQGLMLMIHNLYKDNPLDLDLCSDFWYPSQSLSSSFSPRPVSALHHKLTEKQIMLNKFVRLAGDLLLQPMFSPYVKMLTSLASNTNCAQFCFSLLASSDHSGRTSSCSVSWDHFFHSLRQYYVSFSQSNSQDHQAHTHGHHAISPDEVEGLQAVLTLIKTVAKESEMARMAFCENQSWLPIATLFGLLGCPIPLPLKASLLDALSVFALSSELVSVLWQSLEASQILQTVKSKDGSRTSGIVVELDEIEARNESYPETFAFLDLLHQLIKISVPTTLGAGYRTPGFQPYLEFIIDAVFLRFNTRAYQNREEKWKIASKVLDILSHLLDVYEPSADNFTEHPVEIQGVQFGNAVNPPGYYILLYLLNDTPVFRRVLNTLVETSTLLSECTSEDDSKGRIEATTCSALRLLLLGLKKQDTFLDLARNHNSTVLASSLNELLLSINPVTGEADYLVHITKLITLNIFDPKITLSVIEILHFATLSANVQSRVVSILNRDEVTSLEILVGFSEHLECEEQENIDDLIDSEQVEEIAASKLRCKVRQAIVELLLATIEHPKPSLAHYLLGFNVKQHIAKTVLQDPGVGGFPKTCLHGILNILNKDVNAISHQVSCHRVSPRLTELFYHVIYKACAHYDGGAPFQRYLRTNFDFFCNHAALLPITEHFAGNEESTPALWTALSNQEMWLMRTLAIEIKVTSQTRLRSHVLRLIDILFGKTGNTVTHNTTNTSNIGHSFSMSALHNSTMMLSRATLSESTGNIISSVLLSLNLEQDFPEQLNLSLFDYSAIESLIGMCQVRHPDTGLIRCNVKQLHRILMTEISNAVQGSTSRREDLSKEVNSLLRYTVECNSTRELLVAKRNAIEAWGHVVEVAFMATDTEMLPEEKRKLLLVEILTDLLKKLGNNSSIPELVAPASNTVLMLMTNLKEACLSSLKNDNKLTTQQWSLDSSQLGVILDSLVECIIKAGDKNTSMRANLYGAFLCYVQLRKQLASNAEGAQGSSIGRSASHWEGDVLSITSKHGDSFMEIVCRDACDGANIVKMLALSVLDAIVTMDWQRRWVSFMSSRGYLRHLIDIIAMQDQTYVMLLSHNPESLKPLFMFESIMSFLTKVAQSELGAHALLQSGLVSCFSNCQFIEQRPSVMQSIGNTFLDEPNLPSAAERYTQMLVFVLKIFVTILSSLGLQHHDAVSQVQSFMLSHSDVFLDILQSRSVPNTFFAVEELTLTVSIFALFGDTKLNDNQTVVDQGRKRDIFLNQAQRLILSMIELYCSKSRCSEILKQILDTETHESHASGSSVITTLPVLEIHRLLLKLRCSLLAYCRRLVTSNGLSGAYCRVVFSPVMLSNDVSQEINSILSKKGLNRLPSLGIIAQELSCASNDLLKNIRFQQQLDTKINEIDRLSHDDLKHIVNASGHSEALHLPLRVCRTVAVDTLNKQLTSRKEESTLLNQIIEHCLYLLWRHIDYYTVHCVANKTTDTTTSMQKPLDGTPTKDRLRRLQGTPKLDDILSFASNVSTSLGETPSMLTLTQDNMKQLKVECRSFLTDKVWKSVLEAEKVHGRYHSRLGYTAAMVRRIQGLIV